MAFGEGYRIPFWVLLSLDQTPQGFPSSLGSPKNFVALLQQWFLNQVFSCIKCLKVVASCFGMSPVSALCDPRSEASLDSSHGHEGHVFSMYPFLWILEYTSSLSSRPVISTSEPGTLI